MQGCIEIPGESVMVCSWTQFPTQCGGGLEHQCPHSEQRYPLSLPGAFTYIPAKKSMASLWCHVVTMGIIWHSSDVRYFRWWHLHQGYKRKNAQEGWASGAGFQNYKVSSFRELRVFRCFLAQGLPGKLYKRKTKHWVNCFLWLWATSGLTLVVNTLICLSDHQMSLPNSTKIAVPDRASKSKWVSICNKR